MKVNHPFIYICLVIFAFVIIGRVLSPQLDMSTKILYVLGVVGFFVLCSFLILYLEVLEAGLEVQIVDFETRSSLKFSSGVYKIPA